MKELDFERELLRLAENTNGKVQDLFTKYIGELAALGVHSTKGKEGFFHFEDDIPKMLQPKVNEIMSRFNKDLLSELRTGVDAAVGVSESKHTDVIKRMFDSPLKLSEPRKKEAREAFVNERMKPAGKLALSDRVWNFTSQGKAEVEAAMSLAIEDGVVEAKTAAELGRSVRKYLNDPDSMYRRYHKTKVLSDGTKKDVIVWKKRVIGADGKVHFVDTELEAVGQGVYRSARANAERCTRSEINGAYRYADYERWNEEPFVIGIKIGLSNNHTVKKEVRRGKRTIKVDVPLKDICDDLAGVYPKTFKWAGWHPHCRCHAVPVMADKADRQQWLAEGCPDHFFDDKQIKDVPEEMREWWRKNGDKAMRAKSVPFWIQDNMKGAKSGTPEFLGFKVPKQKMTIELLEKNGWKVDLLGGAKFEGMVEDFDFVSFGKQFDALMDERKIPRYEKPLSVTKSVKVLPNGNFTFEIEYMDVDLIRTFSKNGDKLTVLHDLFTVSKAYQGKGFSKDVFGALYSEYQKLGVSEIKVHANINVGGYTWAKYGFTMDVNQAKGLCGRLRTKVSTKKELLKIVEDFEKAHPGERFPMNLLTKHPGAKDALLGSDWLGVLDLKNESQRALFESYIGLLPNASAAKAKKTPLEIAFERHSKRTPESIAETMKRWNKRINDRTKNELRELLAEVEKNDFTKQIKHDIGQLYVDKRTGLYHAGKVEDIKRRLNIAKAATERHATRDAAAIQEAWTNSRKKSIAQIAKERHDARTPEYIAAVQAKWNKRINDRTKNSLRDALAKVENSEFSKKIKHDIGQLYIDKRTGLYHAGKVEDIKRRLEIAKAATERHSTRDAKAIQNAWDARKVVVKLSNEDSLLIKELDGIKDVDTSKIKKLLSEKNADSAKINKELDRLKQIKSEIDSLTILDDPMKVARETSLAEAKTIAANVKRTLGKMSDDLDSMKRSLEFEISWMESTGKTRYPGTYKYSRDAYKKELAIVEQKIKVRDIEKDLEDAFKWAESSSKDQRLISLVDKMKKDLADSSMSLSTLRSKADAIKLAYDAEYKAVKKWIDLEEKARMALEYADTSKSKMYKTSADEIKTLLADRTKKFESVEKKVDALVAKYNDQIAKEMKKRGASSGYRPETLEQIKNRLGSNFPDTLENLNGAIADYEKTSKYGASTKANANEVAMVMREIFAIHDYGMNIDDSLLETVLKSKFKNTFEVGKSGGYNGSSKTTGPIEVSHGRLRAAHNLFGLGKHLASDQLPRAAYEKYGNLLDHDILRSIKNNTATGYGNVEVRFRKDKVVCTWTAGDSLGETWQPTLTTDPRACSYDNVGGRTSYISLPTKASDTSNLVEFKRKHISGYLELQYHGELGVDAVESITFPYDITQSKYLGVAKKWKSIGVRIYYVDGNSLKEL